MTTVLKEIIATGKDIEDAKETARMILGVTDADDVKYEVLEAGSRGILGIIGVKPAKVKAMIETGEPEPKKERKPREDKVEETGDEPRRNRDRRNRNRRGGKKREKFEIPEMPETPAKPHEAMIPETELKMEKIEATESDLAYTFVTTLLKNIGLNATAELYACEDNTRRVIISGEEASALIGHHGDTLEALQYLTNLAGSQKTESGERNRQRVTVDIEGYRAKREETLRALARRMAAKALRNGRSVMLEPMSPYERRIIHSEVQNIEGVSTNSVGSDNNRKVVIYIPKKATTVEEAPEAAAVENADE